LIFIQMKLSRYDMDTRPPEVSLTWSIVKDNAQAIKNLHTIVEKQQKIVNNLNFRIDYLTLILSQRTVTVESRV